MNRLTFAHPARTPMIIAILLVVLALLLCAYAALYAAGAADHPHAPLTRNREFLANKRGISLVVALLLHTGALCAKCGYGTRVTSKRWAKCKRCGERTERRPMPETER